MKTRLQRRLDWTYFWCAILAVNYASFIKPQLFFPKIPAQIGLPRSGGLGARCGQTLSGKTLKGSKRYRDAMVLRVCMEIHTCTKARQHPRTSHGC